LTDEKSNVKHHLSKEHQMYFETITKYLLSNEPNLIQKAMLSLRIDAGIQQLLPYFIQFVSEMVVCVFQVRKRFLSILFLDNETSKEPGITTTISSDD
jgi:hypothetical protein